MHARYTQPIVIAAATMILTVLLVSGCDDFFLSDVFYKPTGIPLEIRPTAVVIRAETTTEFVGVGGTPSYTFRVLESGGGEIDPTTGEYTAPEVPGEYYVGITDRLDADKIALVYVYQLQPLWISPSVVTVPQGTSRQFSAGGGAGSYAFSVSDPDLGTIDAASGLFTADDAFEDSTNVSVTDGESIAFATVTVSVPEAELAIHPDRDTIAQGEYVRLTVTGGVGDYTFEQIVTGTGGTVDTLTSNRWEYTAADGIGIARFRVTDSAVSPVAVEIGITVVPVAPTAFYAERLTGPPRVKLTWQHDRPGIDEFRIRRSGEMHDGFADHATVAFDAPRSYEYIDEGVGPNEPVFYRIRAVAGSSESAWVATHP